jgi:hypothetical protein
MEKTFLVITSIASSENPVLKLFVNESAIYNIPYIVVGDTKSPPDFNLPGCDFYSIERQRTLQWQLAKELPVKHYSRKNLGYLVAMEQGAEIIIETDDDNLPYADFWKKRNRSANAHPLMNKGWVNVYRYFSKSNIWPRGFALEKILNPHPVLQELEKLHCPIQQGLADDNPDIDAIYRLTEPLPIKFDKHDNVAIGTNTWCPFNSQNTTWFKEAFLLLYLPSSCSFRMTDIWRSFVAERISWTCGWNILFHNSTVYQERNDHNILTDFKDEISGYLNNHTICSELKELELKEGKDNIPENLTKCYQLLYRMELVDESELHLLRLWIDAVKAIESGVF